MLELVPEHDDSAVEAFVEVGVHDPAAVHVGVGLDRGDKGGHPLGRAEQLVGEVARGQRCGDPSERLAGRLVGQRGDLLQPSCVEPGCRERLSKTPRLWHAQRLDPVEHLVLGVGGVQRAHRRAGGGLVERAAVQLDELRGVLALDARRHERADRRADRVERFDELGCGTARGGGGVVELVREPSRHRAQRGEPLAGALDGGQPRHHGPDLTHDAAMHGRRRERELDEPRRRDQGQAACGQRMHLDAERAFGERGDSADPRRADLTGERLFAIPGDERGLQLPLEQEQEPARAVALPDQHVSGDRPERLGRLGPHAQLLVVEVVEEVDGTQVGDGELRSRHACARYSWMSETAIEPSPTALATRLIDRARTSPATKTPGTEVSRR